MSIDTTPPRRILFFILILLVCLPTYGDQRLVSLIDQSCTQAGDNLHKELQSRSWGNPPTTCSSPLVPKDCQDSLQAVLTEAISKELDQELGLIRQKILSELSGTQDQIGYLYTGIHRIITGLRLHWSREVAGRTDRELSKASDSDLQSMPPPGLPLKVITGFASDCRTTLIPGISMMLCDLDDGGEAASRGVDCGTKKQLSKDGANDDKQGTDRTDPPPGDGLDPEGDDEIKGNKNQQDKNGNDGYINLTRAQIAQIAAEQTYLDELNKDTGFSRVVSCEWTEGVLAPYLKCNPGLRVSGHDIGVIQIVPSTDPKFQLQYAQAFTAEELPIPTNSEPDDPFRDLLSCPLDADGKMPSLACDELCFGKGNACKADSSSSLKTRSTMVAVHLKRRFDTTYGCAVHSWGCAQKRLRGNPSSNANPFKLSILTKGRSPVIRVTAMDAKGRVAVGYVLVGYPRWRVESGGFMGITWNAVDQVVDKSAVDQETQKVEILNIRDSDTYAQETGVFVNFIPSNYEWFGVSLGFATSNGKAPSVYLGPTVRLRTFGNRGIAALSAGVAMRQVDRFPGLNVGDKVPDGSALLTADPQFEVDGYLGIQLGFSFGPINVADSGD